MRTLFGKFGLTVSIMMLMALSAGSASADLPNDCPDHKLEGDIKGNLNITNSCDIFGHIDGNICINSGTLFVHGSVDRNIEQNGVGSVVVNGSVKGNIKENGNEDIQVWGTVDSNLKEEGSGHILIFGSLEGKLSENGDGLVFVGGDVDGNVNENGAGDVYVGLASFPSATVEGNVKENDAGSCQVHETATVEGKLKCD